MSTSTARRPGSAASPSTACSRSTEGGPGLEAAIDKVCQQVSEAIALGANIIVLSDRNAGPTSAPIPSLLLTAAVHNHLVREKERTRVGLVVESGDAREVHHFALLIGYGAAAVNPYLALESVAEMVRDGLLGEASEREAFRKYLKAASKGVLKVMSKMGISTVASYTGAQVFEAIGLDRGLVDRYFGSTPSRLGGVGLAELAEEVARRHRYAYAGAAGRPRARSRSMSAASTSGAGRVSTTCSTPRPSSSCSTPHAPSASTSSGSTAPWSTSSPSGWRPCAACCDYASATRRCGHRSRSTRSSRSRPS